MAGGWTTARLAAQATAGHGLVLGELLTLAGVAKQPDGPAAPLVLDRTPRGADAWGVFRAHTFRPGRFRAGPSRPCSFSPARSPRRTRLDHLPHIRIPHAVPEADKTCSCRGGPTKTRIGRVAGDSGVAVTGLVDRRHLGDRAWGKGKKGGSSKGRFWAYIGDAEHPYSVYDFTVSRGRDGPAAFLKDYQGFLQADAYGGYDGIFLGSQEKIVEVACRCMRVGSSMACGTNQSKSA